MPRCAGVGPGTSNATDSTDGSTLSVGQRLVLSRRTIARTGKARCQRLLERAAHEARVAAASHCAREHGDDVAETAASIALSRRDPRALLCPSFSHMHRLFS